jgi:ribosomal protein S18 acetylase RimI-like enzyme
VFPIYVGPEVPRAFAIGVEVASELVGYLFAEVRAVEFGADPAGWVFAVGVDPAYQRQGYARALLSEARQRFQRLGVRFVRTMVKRDDVSILSFFRSAGFVGGPFVQLEVDLKEEA